MRGHESENRNENANDLYTGPWWGPFCSDGVLPHTQGTVFSFFFLNIFYWFQ